MKIKILAVFVLLITLTNTAFAENSTIIVTPAQTITTARKNSLSEGDYVDFKIIEGAGKFQKGSIVTGIVTSLEENGFAGKEANVLIENFKCNEEPVYGEIYLHGNVHKKLNDFVDSSFSGFPIWMRGGEVVARPGEQEFLLKIRKN